MFLERRHAGHGCASVLRRNVGRPDVVDVPAGDLHGEVDVLVPRIAASRLRWSRSMTRHIGGGALRAAALRSETAVQRPDDQAEQGVAGRRSDREVERGVRGDAFVEARRVGVEHGRFEFAQVVGLAAGGGQAGGGDLEHPTDLEEVVALDHAAGEQEADPVGEGFAQRAGVGFGRRSCRR